MSEGSAGPELGPNYPVGYSNPPSQPPTPSSTVQDPPNFHSSEVSDNSSDSKPVNNVGAPQSGGGSGLPPFSSFSTNDVQEGLGGRLAADGYLTADGISSTRVMELSGWDYCYTDGLGGRYLERGDAMPVMVPQPQYRPWESKQDGGMDGVKSTLPSFQSQFGEELVTTLTTLTPAACSPAPSVPSPSLPSFHTLSAVNPRYPLVPAPVQAREIPSIQQQFLDERHIHLFQGPPGQNFAIQPQNGATLTTLNNGTTLTTLNNAQYHPQIINNAQILPSGQILTPQSHILAPSNGHIMSSSGGQTLAVVSQTATPTVLTVMKGPVNIVELKSNSTSESTNLTQLHHANFQNPLITQGQQLDSKFGLESPPRGIDGRKKERRKIRASSLESSNESDGAMSVESSGQVAAVSSTAGFKSPMTPGQMNNEGEGITDTGEKQTKKKRKRCGECIGCQRKDNCGDCAPCRNDKSHQICKMRRCEKLTEKKHLLAYNREDGGVTFRGRGRGRGRGSRGGYRGKAPRPGTQSAQGSAVQDINTSSPLVTAGRDSAKLDGSRLNPGSVPNNPSLAPTMAVPFYSGTDIWPPTANPADPWASQGQFIHQIDDIRYQHYPGYQSAGYQQSGFISESNSAFQPQYANNGAGSNSSTGSPPGSGNGNARPASGYSQSHTPAPSPGGTAPSVNGHRNGIGVHYVEENYVNGNSFSTDSSMAPPASTTPSSRSSSVHLEPADKTSYNSMSGNAMPGYPASSPQSRSLCNSSAGYPGQSALSEYGDQIPNGTPYQQANQGQPSNHVSQKSPSYAQASPSTYQSYQFSEISPGRSPKPGTSPGHSNPSPSYSQKPQGSGFSPKGYSSNPSPSSYPAVSPGQQASRGYDNRTPSSVYQDRYDNYSLPSPGQDKNNVNARIKTMILNKQTQVQQGGYMQGGGAMISSNQMQGTKDVKGEMTDNGNHFLGFSHHLRSGSKLYSEGGGDLGWPGYQQSLPSYYNDPYNSAKKKKNCKKKIEKKNDSMSAMENFMKFASADFDKMRPYAPVEAERKLTHSEFEERLNMYDQEGMFGNIDPIRTLEATFPTKRLLSPYEADVKPELHRRVHSDYENVTSTNYLYPKKQSEGEQMMLYRPPSLFNTDLKQGPGPYEKEDYSGYYGPAHTLGSPGVDCTNFRTQQIKEELPEPKVEPEDEQEEESDSLFKKVYYAPKGKSMEVIDRRFIKTKVKNEKWEEYLSQMQKERKLQVKNGEEEKQIKKEEESYAFCGAGGPVVLEKTAGAWCCRQGGTETPTPEHLRDGCCQGLQTQDEVLPEKADAKVEGEKNQPPNKCKSPAPAESEHLERAKSNARSDVPDCHCFPSDKSPPEPGSFYTHLGAFATLPDLREDLEKRTGESGKALRVEKICYTGKEGKTTQGCPLAKWVIRRSGIEEKYLAMVKHRQGHTCPTAWIVVCLVAWDGVPPSEADQVYAVLAHKLNRFGLPTTRRCATNEPRTCACQGLDPDSCGASYSFGCSWSMYYNGCKYARSKTVRKFRLSVRSEEQEIEERMHVLATLLSPLYNSLAPEAFKNQTMFEREASECRLGFKPGRPFSGVTACIDFCAHAHRDLHNMNNGCTVVVSLTKHRTLSKPDDEQLHVLPLYVMDETDEHGSKEAQEEKYRTGAIECLDKFPCEVRVRAVPLQPCRRHGKKRKEDESEGVAGGTNNINGAGKGKDASHQKGGGTKVGGSAPGIDIQTMLEGMEVQLQSSQVSSTVLDSPVGMYQGWGYQAMQDHMDPANWAGHEGRKSWLPSLSAPPWDCRSIGEKDADPDSTTTHNLASSPSSVRSSTVGTPASSSPLSSPSWQTGSGLEGTKLDVKEEYPESSSPFRVPKGRPPSRQSQDCSETFLKPLPKQQRPGGDPAESVSAQNPFAQTYPFNQNNYGGYQNYGVEKPTTWEYMDGRSEGYGYRRWDLYGPTPYMPPVAPEPQPPKPEPLGEVTDFIENEECFKDPQMGGVAIALGHGSVLIECAKLELHATTALRRPDRLQPTRISLVFYQHRNLNRGKHGWEEWEEKMRLRKLGITTSAEKGKESKEDMSGTDAAKLAGLERPLGLGERCLVRVPTYTTTTWTTLFPMRGCVVTGPYQEGGGPSD